MIQYFAANQSNPKMCITMLSDSEFCKNHNEYKTRALLAVPMLASQGPSFYLKIQVWC